LERDGVLIVGRKAVKYRRHGCCSPRRRGVKQNQSRGPADVLPQPEDAAVDALVEGIGERALVRRKDEVHHLVLGGEETERRPSHLAREFRAPGRVGHGPREDGLDRRGEEVEAFEEERPFLGVEEREARVDVELRDIGLDL
jgi:hypothetical protein